jgi:hypothetical protein
MMGMKKSENQVVRRETTWAAGEPQWPQREKTVASRRAIRLIPKMRNMVFSPWVRPVDQAPA